MKKERIDALSDGIFAIVMTLLVLEIQVPELAVHDNVKLFHQLIDLWPLFLSYIISFAMLFTYWRGHNYIISIFAKNIDVKLANYNALFFFFVALVPFSSHFLGRYSDTQLGLLVFGLNTILIGLSLFFMRNYVLDSDSIENAKITARDIRHGTIRIMIPTIFAAGAMVIGLVNIQISLMLFTVAILFNLFPRSADMVDLVMFRKEYIEEHTQKKSRTKK